MRVAIAIAVALVAATPASAGDHPGGDFVWANPLGGTVFSHANHAALGMKDCTECHTAIFPLARTDDLSMKAMNNGRECGACHASGGRAFDMQACTTCHRATVMVPDIVYPNDALGNTTFSHATHTGRHPECLTCHGGPFKMPRGTEDISMERIDSRAQCGVCHYQGAEAFPASECTKCHVRQGGR